MTARFASQQEIDNWNSLVITNPDGGNIFQATEFAHTKRSNNWSTRFLVVDNLYILVLQRKIPTLGNFWYVPKGPGINNTDELSKLLPRLREFAAANNVFTVKMESELLATEDNLSFLSKSNLPKSRAVQAANTVIVDISADIDTVVASFSPKTRASIRSAQKADIKIEVVPINDANCKIFYDLMVATINGRSHLRSFDYFKTFWQSHYNAGNGIFIFASVDGEILSMDFIMILGNKATRKDAASSRQHSVRGVSALLEKFAIEYLKTLGVTKYDLYGSPPSDQIKNPNHPYYGFGTFKAGFNANITDYVGCFDLIIKPRSYKIWVKAGERIVHRVYRQRHRDLYY